MSSLSDIRIREVSGSVKTKNYDSDEFLFQMDDIEVGHKPTKKTLSQFESMDMDMDETETSDTDVEDEEDQPRLNPIVKTQTLFEKDYNFRNQGVMGFTSEEVNIFLSMHAKRTTHPQFEASSSAKNETSYTCLRCEYSSQIRAVMFKHIRRVHFKEGTHVKELYECSICSFSTKIHDSLLMHFRMVHSNIQYKKLCLYCPYSTDKRFKLRRHMVIRHGRRVWCVHCLKFKTKHRKALLTHINAEHPNGHVSLDDDDDDKEAVASRESNQIGSMRQVQVVDNVLPPNQKVRNSLRSFPMKIKQSAGFVALSKLDNKLFSSDERKPLTTEVVKQSLTSEELRFTVERRINAPQFYRMAACLPGPPKGGDYKRIVINNQMIQKATKSEPDVKDLNIKSIKIESENERPKEQCQKSDDTIVLKMDTESLVSVSEQETLLSSSSKEQKSSVDAAGNKRRIIVYGSNVIVLNGEANSLPNKNSQNNSLLKKNNPAPSSFATTAPSLLKIKQNPPQPPPSPVNINRSSVVSRSSEKKNEPNVVRNRSNIVIPNAIVKYKCKYCKYNSLARIDVERHAASSHAKAINELSLNTWACKYCDYSVGMKWELAKHHRRVHQIIYPDQPVFECPSCMYCTQEQGLYKRHQERYHSSNRKCPLCDFMSYRTDNVELRSHIAEKHQAGRKKICNECSFYCFDDATMNRHKMSKHSF